LEVQLVGLFGKAKTMAKLGKKFGECRAEHPEVWALGNEMADASFAARTPYLLERIKAEGEDDYIRLASTTLMEALGNGTFEDLTGVKFPEPVTDGSATCFGIAFSTRLVDLFDEERTGA